MKQHPISFSNPYLLCICCSSPLGNCGQMRLNIPKIAHKHSCFIKCSTFHLMGQCAPYFLGMYGTHIYLTNNCIWNTSATIIFFTFLKSSFAFFPFLFFGGEGCLRKKMFPPFFFLLYYEIHFGLFLFVVYITLINIYISICSKFTKETIYC